ECLEFPCRPVRPIRWPLTTAPATSRADGKSAAMPVGSATTPAAPFSGTTASPDSESASVGHAAAFARSPGSSFHHPHGSARSCLEALVGAVAVRRVGGVLALAP